MATGSVINNPTAFRFVPGFKNVIAVKAVSDVDSSCTECHGAIKKGQAVWYCDGKFMNSGQDGRWHDHCLTPDKSFLRNTD